ncbi:4-alpha-glucanotransferase [Rhodobacter sp. NTK016B]|uniref:4-alpha-glucanotransferase n=1 Tax=Rhodobacter sp. NTK016B TaxID=2759676 RepID=UPI001A90BAE9|nr:4-alpha-glucanotransferase [Rhodobacter sp. NTK016B]MBN8291317.1 4-alpha-glucanotransferase [Rhodobacter sp. NTK016B]
MSALDDLCHEAGLVWVYRDGAGRMQEAPEASREAVLAALGHGNADAALPGPLQHATSRAIPAGISVDWGPGPWRLQTEDGKIIDGEGPLPPLPLGYHRLEHNGWLVHLLAAPPRLPLPPRRWGATLPLFACWEESQSGMGTYPQLGLLAEGLASKGAAFLGINPIHAGFPEDATNFSPYAPSHRRRLNVQHIDTGRPLPETGALIDYARTIPAQRAALEAAFAAFEGSEAFDAWCTAGGAALEEFTIHQALSEVHGAYWHDWPDALQDPANPAVRAFARENEQRLRFHAWAQWMAETQLSDSQHRAKMAGMPFGLYLDIAVGTHPHGAETWAERGSFAQGVSLGAPPDLLGPSGQRWGLAPLRPDVLRATGYAAFAQTLRAQLKYCGLLRIDHILGLERSFWLPNGLPGLYVTMPRDELLAVLRIEAQRADAPVIGEDLGTIPDGLRAALDAAGVMGCRVAMFERDWNGTRAFLPPEVYTPTALASWGTHDLPTWEGWRKGRDIDWRAQLGEVPDEAAARQARAEDVAAFDALTGGSDMAALHRHLAQSASALVAIQGEDLAGAVEQANLPGTVFEHPNWCRRLPLPLSGLISAPSLEHTSAIMAEAGRIP